MDQSVKSLERHSDHGVRWVLLTCCRRRRCAREAHRCRRETMSIQVQRDRRRRATSGEKFARPRAKHCRVVKPAIGERAVCCVDQRSGVDCAVFVVCGRTVNPFAGGAANRRRLRRRRFSVVLRGSGRPEDREHRLGFANMGQQRDVDGAGAHARFDVIHGTLGREHGDGTVTGCHVARVPFEKNRLCDRGANRGERLDG